MAVSIRAGNMMMGEGLVLSWAKYDVGSAPFMVNGLVTIGVAFQAKDQVEG